MAAERVALDAWLFDLLAGDPSLAGALSDLATIAYAPDVPPSSDWSRAWYPDVAPESAAQVYGVWSWVPTPDTQGMGGVRVAVASRLYIAVWAPAGSYDILAPVADRLDTLLHGASGTASGLTIASCLRVNATSHQEDDQGVRWLSLGGIYAVHAYTE